MAGPKQRARATSLAFVGPPDAAEAYVPVDPARRREVRVSVATDDGWTPVRVLTAPAGSQTLVRLVLPSTTATLDDVDAMVEIGDERFEAVVRLDARAELEASPTALDLDVKDATAEATLQVVNVGNVAVEIPDISAFGLMMEGGVETAIGSGLMSSDTGIDRVGRFADALAERHGGLARVSVEAGAGRLEPGASTVVRARIRLGDRPGSGQHYHGTWPLATLRIPVSLHVPAAPVTASRPRRATKKKGTSS